MDLDGLRFVTIATVKRLAELRGSSLLSLGLDGAELTDGAIDAIVTYCPQIERLSMSFSEDLTDELVLFFLSLQTLYRLASSNNTTSSPSETA